MAVPLSLKVAATLRLQAAHLVCEHEAIGSGEIEAPVQPFATEAA